MAISSQKPVKLNLSWQKKTENPEGTKAVEN